MKKLAGFALAATTMLATLPTGVTAYASEKYTLMQSQISADGTMAATPSWFVKDKTAHMPVWYVMQVLQNSLNIKNLWNGAHGRWDLTVPSDVQPDLSNIHPGNGNIGIYINGTLVQRINSVTYVDPSSGKATAYMPVWYVMQLLQRLNIVSTWDTGTWNLFTNIPADELKAYQKAHPGEKVGFMTSMRLLADDKPSLVIENAPAPGKQVTVTVVSPTLSVKDIQTNGDNPGYVQSIPTSIGNMIAAYVGIGAHSEGAYILQNSTDGVKVVQSFEGSNGTVAWVQDGAPQVMVSNRMYENNLKLPDGSMDDRTETVVYKFSNGSFSEISRSSSGTFGYAPQFQLNPQVSAVSLFEYVVHSNGNVKQMASGLQYFALGTFSASFLTDLSAVDMSAMKYLTPTQSLVLKTEKQTASQAVYSTMVGTHTYYITLTHTDNWQFTGFSN